MRLRPCFAPLYLLLSFFPTSFLTAQSLPLDAAFGTQGMATLDYGSDSPGRATLSAIAADGKVLVGGYSFAGLSEPFRIARFLPNGTPDATFGSAGSTQHARLEGAIKLHPLPDGKMLVLAERGFRVDRLLADGSYDATFTSAPVPDDEARLTFNSDLTVQPDGKILVTAFSQDAPFDKYCVARFLPDGQLDTGFGKNGRAFQSVYGAGTASAVALQADGNILVTGSGGNYKISTARYTPAGLPDSTFGTNGLAIWGPVIGDFLSGRDMSVQPDGKIVVAAEVLDEPSDYAALYRMNPDGSPDTGFGTGGMVSSIALTRVYGLCLQTNGQILIGGRYKDYASLLRFQPNGLPDNSYTAKTTLGAWLADDDGDRIGFALQPDNKAVVAVPSVGFAAVSQGFFAVRLSISGSADPGFSSDGRAFATYSSGDDRITDIALQPDGKILVIGEAYSNYLDAEVVLARYSSTGQLDPAFGNGGKKAFTILPGDNAYAYAVAVQPDGKILAAAGLQYGFPPIQLKVLRFMPDGSVDASFGTGGKVDVPGKFFRVNDLLLQPDGKILLGGTLEDRRFTVVRLNANGTPDTGFGSGGTAAVTVLAGSNWPYTAGFGLLPDGRIVMGGCVPFEDKVAAIRLKANGTLDPTFSGDGKGLYPVPDNYYTYSFAVQPDGKILLGGGLSTPDYNLRFAVTRILADGTALDAGFGTGGNAVLDFAPKSSGYADALAVLPDGRIVAAGREYTPGRTRIAAVRLLADGKIESGTLVLTDLGENGNAYLSEAAVQPDGRVILGGMVRSATDLDFALLRYVPAPLVATHEQEAPTPTRMAQPNPFSHSLRLDFSDLPTPVEHVAVYAPDGRVVFSASQLSSSVLEIDDAWAWPAGLYVVQAFAAGRYFVQRVVK